MTDEGIYFVSPNRDAIDHFDFATGKLTQIAAIGGKLPIRDTSSIALSPDHRWILYNEDDQFEKDIMLVEYFRWLNDKQPTNCQLVHAILLSPHHRKNDGGWVLCRRRVLF